MGTTGDSSSVGFDRSAAAALGDDGRKAEQRKAELGRMLRVGGFAACRWAVITCELMGWLIASPADAHHSAAMFDRQKAVTLQGTVKEFQWTNPHCWIELLVTARDGVSQWSIEMISPSELYRLGWRPGSLRVGEHLTVVVNPVRDGTRGGQFVWAITADGRRLGYAAAAGAKP